MLAYVFWHRPAHAADPVAYEEALGGFHEALAEGAPPGFRRSLAFRVAGAPWLGGDGYEDWYLLDGSEALDPLDRAAVDSTVGLRHDAVAGLAGEGTGGLYRLRAGPGALDGAAAASWLAKPAGTTYEELYALLARWTDVAGLWGRQMVLGPTPEFCLHNAELSELPGELGSLTVGMTRVWP